MGCGASKAALVSENDINILTHPRTAEDDDSEMEENTAGEPKEKEEGDAGRVDPAYSSQSEIERAVREATSPNTTTPSFSSAVTNAQNQLQPVPTSTSAPMVFEVCMSPDDRLEARAPLPQRLKKLESAPVVTAEMLEMKQLKVAERKKEELEKRFARSRMSRKDRLRKEILAARELQSTGEEATMTESFGYSRLHEEPNPIEGGKETREGNGYDNNTQVEGDTTYNEEESQEFWDRGDGEVGQTATSNGGRETDLVRQGSATPGGSSNNLEQYM